MEYPEFFHRSARSHRSTMGSHRSAEMAFLRPNFAVVEKIFRMRRKITCHPQKASCPSLCTSTNVLHLWMLMESFNKLLSFLLPDLIDEDERSSGRGGPIIPELCIYCALRFLANGSYLDIHYFCGISKTSFYTSVWRVIDLLNSCPMLEIHFPQSVAECKVAAQGFRLVSSGDSIVNCVSVVDGLLVRIATPPKKQARNVRSFFSGHYQVYGMNIQAACDHLCRFIFLGVAGPSVMSNCKAVEQVPLHQMIERVPRRYCVIGNCAYRPTEHLVPIFGGAAAFDPQNDNYYCDASQCWIQIEMAFGMMKQKWGILNTPLQIKLTNVKQ